LYADYSPVSSGGKERIIPKFPRRENEPSAQMENYLLRWAYDAGPYLCDNGSVFIHVFTMMPVSTDACFYDDACLNDSVITSCLQ